MNRFEYVIALSTAPQQEPLINLAAGFMLAMQQVTAEGVDPQQDPAILILGAYIAFHTHADVNTNVGYRKLLNQCNERVERPLTSQ